MNACAVVTTRDLYEDLVRYRKHIADQVLQVHHSDGKSDDLQRHHIVGAFRGLDIRVELSADFTVRGDLVFDGHSESPSVGGNQEGTGGGAPIPPVSAAAHSSP